MAISIFMEIESKNEGAIAGGCDISGREEWMECLEMTHHVYSPTDKTTGSITGNRVHEPMTVTKATDVATPVLYRHLCQGIDLANVKLHYYNITSEGREEEFFTIVLENAKLISMQPTLFNTRTPQYEKMPHLETLSFAYEQITWTELTQNKEHMDNYRNDAS